MLFDKLHHLKKYKGMHPGLDQVITYLSQHDLGKDELGRHELDGDRIFYFVQDNTLDSEPKREFEFHKRYMDVHLLLEGKELIKYGTQVETMVEPYDSQTDFASATSRGQVVFCLKPGNVIAFRPGELHQPNCDAGQGEKVRKVVFKILMDDERTL